MNFELPNERGFTIYTKPKCGYCEKAKELLKNENNIYKIIDCDNYCFHHRNDFISFMKNKTNNTWNNTFPIIFHNEKYIGGFTDLVKYIENLNIFSSNF